MYTIFEFVNYFFSSFPEKVVDQWRSIAGPVEHDYMSYEFFYCVGIKMIWVSVTVHSGWMICLERFTFLF